VDCEMEKMFKSTVTASSLYRLSTASSRLLATKSILAPKYIIPVPSKTIYQRAISTTTSTKMPATITPKVQELLERNKYDFHPSSESIHIFS
jgi:hypothetical protein